MTIIRGTAPPRELHLVTQAVTRRWVDPSGRLTILSLASGNTLLRGPAGFGYTARLYPADPAAFEVTWKAVEDQVPRALDAVEAGNAFREPETRTVLLDLLAIHMARSQDLEAVDTRFWMRAQASMTERMARRLQFDRRTAKQFEIEHHGLMAGGPEALKHQAEAIAAKIYGETVAGIESSSFRADRMLELLAQARRRIATAGIEILVAQSGDFLLGDAPAQGHQEGHPRSGAFGGVTWGAADSIAMPVARRHYLTLGRDEGYHRVNEAVVDELNRRQVLASHRQVGWHPAASLENFVRSVVASKGSS